MSPRLRLVDGVRPDEPDLPVPVLLVDPGGTPGERAVAALRRHCVEGVGVLFLMGSDGWARQELRDGVLVVEIAAHPFTLGQVDVDPEDFPERVGDSVLLLRAEAEVDPERFARAAGETALLAAGPEVELADALAGAARKVLLLGPPPAAVPR
ncbi:MULTISPECIES: hypothetical protein [Actinosynnema]|uniref:hypothetical protein n=1 Tax=Actinosynnema TaxID=40566 RepID=UPI0020A4AC4C|nr:hypothetical protein [Actinosynnema pretiosum]MCP2097154.1 hypothetical protein [Actinosynnema pretiosum]